MEGGYCFFLSLDFFCDLCEFAVALKKLLALDQNSDHSYLSGFKGSPKPTDFTVKYTIEYSLMEDNSGSFHQCLAGLLEQTYSSRIWRIMGLRT